MAGHIAAMRCAQHSPSVVSTRASNLLPVAAPASLLQPHVDSFDYFLGEGMQHVIDSMDGIEIQHPLTCAAAMLDHRIVVGLAPPAAVLQPRHLATLGSALCQALHLQLPSNAQPSWILTCVRACMPAPPLLPPLLLHSQRTHRFWFENPAVSRPIREESSLAAGADQRLFPRECREAVRARGEGNSREAAPPPLHHLLHQLQLLRQQRLHWQPVSRSGLTAACDCTLLCLSRLAAHTGAVRTSAEPEF